MKGDALKQIGLASPDFRPVDFERVRSVLESGNLVQGRWVAELEEMAAREIGCAEVVAVSSGTAALHLALLACGIGVGDEVIVPAFSFMASANTVVLSGAKPVFVDIEGTTFNLDPDLVEHQLSERTRALLPVHEFGLPCDLDSLEGLARKHGLALIEDAACAIGTSWGKSRVGNVGRVGAFSLHPRKVITCGEGGLLSTDDTDLAKLLRSLRNHGLELGPRGERIFARVGFNYRMTDFQAAIAYGQFARLDEILARRAAVAEHLLAGITNPRITLPSVPSQACPNWQTFHLMLDRDLDQTSAVAQLAEAGIHSGAGAQCMPAELSMQLADYPAEQCWPQAWRAANQGLAIPCHEAMLEPDIERVIVAVNSLS